MNNLEQRLTKAESLPFGELIKFLPQYLEIANEIYKNVYLNENDFYYFLVSSAIFSYWGNLYGYDRIKDLESTINKAIKDKDFIKLYSIQELLNSYKLKEIIQKKR